MERNPILTIYIPTYNRAQELSRLYDSLLSQTCHDFILLVIDDGSTDGTGDLVRSWEAPFEIRYLYKENGGVHTARDAAYHACDTELIVGIDSDDWLLPDAVARILSLWENGGDYLGIILPTMSVDGKLLCPPVPQVKAAEFQEFNHGLKAQGEQVFVLRSGVMKSIPDSPVFPGEKLTPEGWKLIQLPDQPLLLMKEAVIVHSYLDTGYTKNTRQLRKKNIHGFRAMYRMYLQKLRYPLPWMKNLLKYIWTYLVKNPAG